MKRFFKFTLLSALILGIFGAVLFAAGAAAGADFQTYAKAEEKGRLFRGLIWGGDSHFWESRLERFLDNWGEKFGEDMEDWGEHFGEDMEHWGESVGEHAENWGEDISDRVEGWVRGLTFADWDYQDETYHTSQKTIEADNFRKLILHADSGRVELQPVEGKEIKISGIYDEDKIDYSDSGELEVERDGIEGMSSQEVLRVQIPRILLDKAEIECTEGELLISGALSARQTEISVTAGHLQAELSAVEQAEVEADASKVEIKLEDSLEDYRIEMENRNGQMNLGDESYVGGLNEGTFGSLRSGRRIELKAEASQVDVDFEK